MLSQPFSLPKFPKENISWGRDLLALLFLLIFACWFD